eukprot:2856168-Pleurochrysis_carterae.AAC.1
MSLSSQASVSAAARSASRSSCLAPAKRVVREDRWTGWQLAVSAQSQTVPRAHAGISSCCVTVTVGTLGTRTSSPWARARSAATATSAAANHVSTLSACTPGRNRSAIPMGPLGLGAPATSHGGRRSVSRGRAGRSRRP